MSRADRLVHAFATDALAAPEAGDILVIRPASGALAEAVEPNRIVFETGFRPTHDALAAAGLRVVTRADGPAAMAIVTVGRSRAENLGDAARALRLLPPGGLLVIDGAKTDGIDSLVRQIGAALPIEGSVAKAHGKVVWAARPEALPREVSVWEDAARLAPNPAGFVTAPGMFSPETPDPGSRRLAEALDGRLSGRVADLGAGWGWLAAEALARCPKIAAIELFEADAAALDAARVNVDDARASFHWANVERLARVRPGFDWAIANPPFHDGRATDPARGAAFIAAAARILKPSGRLLIVANRQLPYERALDAGFARWEKVAEDSAFKVLAADRPRR
jgi:16S rRNA (guanine1207-N2)-methyltransferase